jgi:glycosyltransferase involved in cell wall biosynthesis
MIRICTSLANAGYDVVLAGRTKRTSIPLVHHPFKQKRLHCFFESGKLFYAEYNIRLFFLLLFSKTDGICAIDLDTILPVYFVSKIKKIKRIYDAHELFCEMKEIVSRPAIYKMWKWIERRTVPYFKNGYTVNTALAHEFLRMYGNEYEVIRSISLYVPAAAEQKREKVILYQGAVNEGRSFETLIPAMQSVNAPLHICGDGNFMARAKQLSVEYGVTDKIEFLGMIPPALLKTYTGRAYIGLTLFEKNGLNNYYSLANRFFDYIHAATPQLCSDYPVYREMNNIHRVAVMIGDLSPANIAKELNALLADGEKWEQLHDNCIKAAAILNWQEEEKKLLAFYKHIFG